MSGKMAFIAIAILYLICLGIGLVKNSSLF